MNIQIDGIRRDEIGNTRISSKGSKVNNKTLQISQRKNWCFTFNNYTQLDIIDILDVFKLLSNKFVFQEEQGENKTPHLQGVVMLKKACRPTELKLNKKIHWECTNNIEASIAYCQKADTRTGEVYKFGFPKEIKTLDSNKLYPWQSEIVDLVKTEPDGRSLHWFIDEVGGLGKSSFSKYMYIKHNCLTIQGGKLADIMNIVFNTNMDEVTCVIIDIPRINKGKVSYASIECILNGHITNTKYETGIKVFNPPHVIVFSNFRPELESMSKDRWKIKSLSSRSNNKLTFGGDDSDNYDELLDTIL